MKRIVGVLAAGLALVGLLLAAGPASAATGTSETPMQRAIVLDTPGVVFVDTSVQIHVRLTYRDTQSVSGIGALSRTYDINWATGSGFVVNSSGTIVTASHVVQPPVDEMRNYAANALVLHGLGYRYQNPFNRYRITDNGVFNQLLQQCYRAVACTFGITPSVSVLAPVQVAGSNVPKTMPARVLTSTGFQATDVAVVQVAGSNMPTVPLATTAGGLQSGTSIVALGFPGSARDSLQSGTTVPTKAFGQVSNVLTQGSSNLIEIDANVQPGMSGGPIIDSQGGVIGLTSFTLLQSSGQPGQVFLRTVDDIRTAIRSAGATAARGTVDASFARAMADFWAHHYSASVPLFQKVLALYPGDLLASQYLGQAQAKAGTAQDVALKAPAKAGFPMWILLVVLAVALGAGGVFLALRGRKRTVVPKPGPVPAVSPATQLAPPPPPPPIAPATFATMLNGSAPAAREPAEPAPTQAEPAASPGGLTTAVRDPAPTEGASPKPQFCAHCGNHVQPDGQFCPSCGSPTGS